MTTLDLHRRDLENLFRKQRLRRLSPRIGIDFSSNDYLGLAGSSELLAEAEAAISRAVSIGSGGSRMLRGNHEEHEALEEEAACFFGCESSLYFSSGFAANSTLVSTLPQRNDCIFFDELIHASCRDGLRVAGAPSQQILHNDAQAFDDAVKRWRAAGNTGQPWMLIESLYSMEGAFAPLAELMEIAEHHDAMLIVDEAHATGVFGSEGRGLAAELEGTERVITVRTCGKALGCEGALVCGSSVVRSFLINRGRGFIFSTAPSPLMAAVVRSALKLIAIPERRTRLHALIDHAQDALARVGATLTGSQIMPLMIGDDGQTMRVADRIQKLGFDVRGIRPPTVPEGTSQLRISLTLNVDEQAIDELADAIASARA